MADKFLIPHPNIPTSDIGLPKLKEVTVKNNENFLALDRLLREFSFVMSDLDRKIDSKDHDHPYAPEEHQHQLSDIDGLIASLELKAPLIHTHEQYLTSVPTHSHTEAEVDGLLADLASKANAVHTHNLGDINNLQVELASKASMWQIFDLENRMFKRGNRTSPSPTSGSSIFPDYKNGYQPESKSYGPGGDQDYLDDYEFPPPPNISGSDNSTPVGWEYGKTAWRNGHNVDESHPAVGCSITVCTHIIGRTIAGGWHPEAFFARLDFDENGLLVRVVPCDHWYQIDAI